MTIMTIIRQTILSKADLKIISPIHADDVSIEGNTLTLQVISDMESPVIQCCVVYPNGRTGILFERRFRDEPIACSAFALALKGEWTA